MPQSWLVSLAAIQSGMVPYEIVVHVLLRSIYPLLNYLSFDLPSIEPTV